MDDKGFKKLEKKYFNSNETCELMQIDLDKKTEIIADQSQELRNTLEEMRSLKEENARLNEENAQLVEGKKDSDANLQKLEDELSVITEERNDLRSELNLTNAQLARDTHPEQQALMRPLEVHLLDAISASRQ